MAYGYGISLDVYSKYILTGISEDFGTASMQIGCHVALKIALHHNSSECCRENLALIWGEEVATLGP